jgi:2-polyprenyl-6-methoxyphenol hydroxylase-like FAD-dependent oxidoreductase
MSTAPHGEGTRFDAVIVGAGPAGATAAIRLARGGWCVALVDKQCFPRRKVCGECIAASNLPLLDALGVGDAVLAAAGPALRRVALMHGDDAVSADLPAAAHPRHQYGRALGRETLDTLLLDRARRDGAIAYERHVVRAIDGFAGAWHCKLRALDTAAQVLLHAPVLIAAHGSWEPLPSIEPLPRAHRGSDLLAFKANFSGASLPPGVLPVLAFPGGYGGMVVADGGMLTLAGCIRADRLAASRRDHPGARAGEVFEALLMRECAGVRDALRSARRSGGWLAAGPLATGVRIGPDARDRRVMLRIGNAAGEAHPIIGEGMSMAFQSAWLLADALLEETQHRGFDALHDAATQRALASRHARTWRRAFTPRLHLAAAFAHLAMNPRSAALLMALLHAWPSLLTLGARGGGKVRSAATVPSHEARTWT